MRVLIIGAGRMGTAMLNAYKKALKSKKKITFEIVEKDKNKLVVLKKVYPSYKFHKEIPNRWNGTILLLAVKPQIFLDVAKEILEKKVKMNFIVSVMAGINTLTIKKNIKGSSEIIRAMPNKGSEIMMGVTAIYSKNKLTKYKKKIIGNLFSPLGHCIWIRKESFMDAVTAISGSGPAYIFLFINTLIDIAKSYGFSNKVAREMVIFTATGALELVKQKSDIIELIEDVKSPGGTTEAAMKVLEEKKGINFFKILNNALNAAKNKSAEISNGVN